MFRATSANFHRIPHPSQNHMPATKFAFHAALTMRSAKSTQHDTSEVLRLPREMTMEASKVPRLPQKLQLIFWKRCKKYCACHTKQLLTLYETRLNVTKWHACHAKRSYATFETSKSDPFCKARHRHGHMGLARTVADGCTTSGEHSLSPQTPRVKREPLLRIREKNVKRLSHSE